MDTYHRIIIGDATNMSDLDKNSIDLVVTSPPYPMIQMWDDLFRSVDPEIKNAWKRSDADAAFELMHKYLDRVWKKLKQVMKPGGLVCINIGDATRNISGRFRLFANHARIISAFQKLGFDQLPTILWRKTTNAPNKFMGSGMLPPNAYVTLEHEYILIFRMGAIREFLTNESRQNRRGSALFWEERNIWFSDVWFGLIGTPQKTNNKDIRNRSGAFPFELPYRLINMFSVKGDIVLDPFMGTGTTMLAAMACGRNSIGYEVDSAFRALILERVTDLPRIANQKVAQRIKKHSDFIQERAAINKTVKNHNKVYDFPVITKQEGDLRFEQVNKVQIIQKDQLQVSYGDWVIDEKDPAFEVLHQTKSPHRMPNVKKGRQLKLF